MSLPGMQSREDSLFNAVMAFGIQGNLCGFVRTFVKMERKTPFFYRIPWKRKAGKPHLYWLSGLVGVTGFEPAAPTSLTWCSTN